jgi:predicted O-methyltransferase YrrM
MLRQIAKSLALTVPPIRRLYDASAPLANAENAALKTTIIELNAENVLLKDATRELYACGVEINQVNQIIKDLKVENAALKQTIEDFQRWRIPELSKLNGLRALLECLQRLGLRAGATAVQAELEGGIGDGRSLNRDGALRDLVTFIEYNEWNNIPEYRIAARLIESLAVGDPVVPEVAEGLERLREALLCLRNQPASHYSFIFMQRKPSSGERFDGSYSPGGLIWPEERNALASLLKEVAGEGMKVAEVGCFLGRGSTRVMAEAVRPHGGSVICVDDFPKFGGFADQRELFEQSTTALGFRNLLQVIDGNGHDVAARFPDGYFDLVYIDAGHSYNDANSDIRAWRSKVRLGGILCGHDCIRTADEFNAEQMQTVMEGDSAAARFVADPRDPSRKVLVHPGVIAAVAENFGTDAKVHDGPLGVWSYHVPRTP